MTTHDHPSDEAKPLEGEFASETDQPDENARPLDTDRTQDEDADQPAKRRHRIQLPSATASVCPPAPGA